MKSSWANVPGQFSIEVYLDGNVVRDTDDKELKPLLGLLNPDDGLELVIDFLSSGYYEPASMYGGSDHLGWPEDGDEERLLDEAYLTDGTRRIRLTQPQQDQLFGFYFDQIEQVELTNEREGDYDQ